MSETKNINTYWEKYRDIYGFETFSAKFREKKIISSLNFNRKHIIEIGFGFRPIIDALSDFEDYVGIEPGLEVFKEVSARYYAKKNVHLINNFLEESLEKIPRETFDVVILPGVLHEVPNPANFLEIAWNLVSEKGVLYINVPNSESLHRKIAVSMGIIQKVDNFTLRNQELGQNNIFSLNSLEALVLSKCKGGSIQLKETFFIKPFTHSQMLSAVENKIISDDVLEGLYNVSSMFPESGSEIALTVQKIS